MKRCWGGLSDFTLSIDGEWGWEWGYFQKKVLVWITEIGCEIVVFGSSTHSKWQVSKKGATIRIAG